MLPEQDAIRLRHMLDAAQEAAGYARGKSRRDIDEDRLLAHGLVHCLAILGEAAAQVSPPTRSALPGVPWRSIVGMRNRLIHAYHDINLDMVWKAVIEDLPPLMSDLEAALREHDTSAE